jgi:hypothetical protein
VKLIADERQIASSPQSSSYSALAYLRMRKSVAKTHQEVKACQKRE